MWTLFLMRDFLQFYTWLCSRQVNLFNLILCVRLLSFLFFFVFFNPLAFSGLAGIGLKIAPYFWSAALTSPRRVSVSTHSRIKNREGWSESHAPRMWSHPSGTPIKTAGSPSLMQCWLAEELFCVFKSPQLFCAQAFKRLCRQTCTLKWDLFLLSVLFAFCLC